MKKILGLSLVTLAAFAYQPDYKQIFLPTPEKKEVVKQEFAKDVRFVIDEKAQIFNDSKKAIGTIYEGTMLKVLKTEKDFTKVSISGQVFEKNKLAFTKNGEFLYLVLDKGNASEEMSFWVKTSSLTSSKDDAFEAVELFYYDTCTSCHSAHAPHEHEVDEWDAYVGAMQLQAKITDAQKDRILRYMQAHASNGMHK